jgi:hypothetical protein
MTKLKSNKGSAVLTTPIVLAISLFFLALFLVYIVNMLMPFIWYEKLSGQTLKYIFVMEEYGYLTNDERNSLVTELGSSGFDTSKITITSTDAPVEYGEPIFLNVIYNYSMLLPVLNNSSLSTVNKDNSIIMNVRRQSISKR